MCMMLSSSLLGDDVNAQPHIRQAYSAAIT
jgi:hypothetical protein